MAIPTTRTQFKDYCLRSLGFGVIDINVSDAQVEDRIDEHYSILHSIIMMVLKEYISNTKLHLKISQEQPVTKLQHMIQKMEL